MLSFIFIIITAKRHVYHDLKRDVFRNILQGLVLAKNYQSNNKRHVVNCVQQVFHQCFDHADNLQALEMCIKCDTVGFIVLIYAYTYSAWQHILWLLPVHLFRVKSNKGHLTSHQNNKTDSFKHSNTQTNAKDPTRAFGNTITLRAGSALSTLPVALTFSLRFTH